MVYAKLRELIKPDCTIIEIGAHIGTDTRKLVKTLKPHRHYAIEPDRRNFTDLWRVCHHHPCVKLIPAAIGDRDAVVDFWLSSGGKGRELTDFNSLKRPLKVDTRPPDVEFRQFKVVCFTLDYLARLYSISEVDLIWMDVQGAELEVFSGATETLKRTRYIYTECQEGRYEGQPGLEKIMKALPRWGMILTNGDNVLLENKGC